MYTGSTRTTVTNREMLQKRRTLWKFSANVDKGGILEIDHVCYKIFYCNTALQHFQRTQNLSIYLRIIYYLGEAKGLCEKRSNPINKQESTQYIRADNL